MTTGLQVLCNCGNRVGLTGPQGVTQINDILVELNWHLALPETLRAQCLPPYTTQELSACHPTRPKSSVLATLHDPRAQCLPPYTTQELSACHPTRPKSSVLATLHDPRAQCLPPYTTQELSARHPTRPKSSVLATLHDPRAQCSPPYTTQELSARHPTQPKSSCLPPHTTQELSACHPTRPKSSVLATLHNPRAQCMPPYTTPITDLAVIWTDSDALHRASVPLTLMEEGHTPLVSTRGNPPQVHVLVLRCTQENR